MAANTICCGDVFELADQATYFVMTLIRGRIGTHSGETGAGIARKLKVCRRVFELP